jgi:hypothetical protein
MSTYNESKFGAAKVSNGTSYVMLNNYCGNPKAGLGCGSAAAVYQPYNVSQAVQNIPVFAGVNYEQAPYMYANNTMNCGQCNGNYCKALAGYHSPVDKQGNPIASATYNKDGGVVSGYAPVSYVARPVGGVVNGECATKGNCRTAGLLRQ